MIQLVIKNGRVIASHFDYQNLRGKYPDCEIILWPDQSIEIPSPDPRTEEDRKNNYKDKRRLAYPTIEEQLEMMYDDKIKGTTTWIDSITAIKERYPKNA